MTPLMIGEVLELALALLGTIADHVAAGKSNEPIEISLIGTQYAQAAKVLSDYIAAQEKQNR